MRLMIDIPDKIYETVQNGTYCGTLYEELKNGTPLSESEDCVSRQAVLNLAKFDGRDGLGSIIHAFDVEQLPPVNPTEKEEVCTDAISRQAAIYVINHAQVNFSVESEIDFTKHEREVHEIIENVLGAQEKALKELPPVTPVEKVGRWIKTIGENGVTSAVRCSECGFEDNRYMLFRYCPTCGTKMEEVEE